MEVIDFRFLTTKDLYDTKYEAWSRIYEYPLVLQKIKELGGNSTSLIHNSSWGFAGVHILFKNDLDSIYPNTIHSDIYIPQEYPNVIKYDITKPIESKYHNYFDFVLNVSTVEEVPFNNVNIIENLLQQVKINGYLIITFDYSNRTFTKEGQGSLNLNNVEFFLNKKIESRPENILNGSNSFLPCNTWSHLNCGLLIIKKLEETISGNSIQHLTFFLEKIKKKEPFSLLRIGDGEMNIVKDIKFYTKQDNWGYQGGLIKDDLESSFIKACILKNLYIGVPCNGCWDNKEILEKYNIDKSKLTYANIFINRNWNKFINFLKNEKIEFYYIGPGTKESDLNITDRFYISENQIERYDEDKSDLLSNLLSWIDQKIREKNSNIFMFSCGPLAKIFVSNLFELYPNNIFLDVGSGLDLDTKGISNRGYLDESMFYTNVVCDFERKHQLYNQNDLDVFIGGWSYTTKEIIEFIKHLKYKDSYNVLEFGSGRSSKAVYDIVSRYCYNISYDVYETEKTNYKNINSIPYKISDIDNLKTLDKKYDIIIIDGPDGNLRAKWYHKIRNNVKDDTIIFIDDYNHYIEFENELNKNFSYKVLSASDEPFRAFGEHSWRIITNINVKPPPSDITVILNVYKRPHTLKQQLEAVKSQTLSPEKIIIYQNRADNSSVYEIPQEIREDKSVTIIESSENFGVWARFAVGLLAKTTYICIFDDDTIPGKKWFENCYNTILEVNGLLGTIGVIFNPTNDKYSMKVRHGWDSGNEKIERVDIVGHSWFFKREWLAQLWSIIPDYSFMDVSGEDMGFSYALQKIGINTYVPPHPKNDLEMYGSIPDSAWKYGMESHAISMTQYSKFNKMYKFFREKGFKLLEDK
jgi:hypothetical protein